MSEGIIIAIISGIFTLLASLIPVLLQRRSVQTESPQESNSEPSPPEKTKRKIKAVKLNTNAYLCISLAIIALLASETSLPGSFSLLLSALSGFTGFRALKQPGGRVPTWVGLVLAVLAAFASIDTMLLDASIRNYPGF